MKYIFWKDKDESEMQEAKLVDLQPCMPNGGNLVVEKLSSMVLIGETAKAIRRYSLFTTPAKLMQAKIDDIETSINQITYSIDGNLSAIQNLVAQRSKHKDHLDEYTEMLRNHENEK